MAPAVSGARPAGCRREDHRHHHVIWDDDVVIVVVGEALVDLVIDPSGAVTAALGGAPFNTARACGRLGADVAFVGAVSVDRFGSMLAGRLADDGVATDRLQRCDLPTTLAAAELDERGSATYRFYFEGTSAPSLTADTAAPPASIVFTGGLGLVLEPMADAAEAWVRAAAASSAAVVVDVNCRPRVVPDREAYVARVERVLHDTTVVKVSDEDLAYLRPGVAPVDAAASLLALGPVSVLLTAGGDAVHVLTAAGAATVDVPRRDVVDTIGAGDSFGGGFLAWWQLAGRTPDELGDLDRLVPAVRAATEVAGVVVTRRGADPPWRRELPDDWV
jgi:fructokinase